MFVTKHYKVAHNCATEMIHSFHNFKHKSDLIVVKPSYRNGLACHL